MNELPESNKYFYKTSDYTELTRIIELCTEVGFRNLVPTDKCIDYKTTYTGIQVHLHTKYYTLYEIWKPFPRISLLELILRLEKAANE